MISLIQESSRMAGTVNLGAATVMGVFAGLLYGGSKEATASVVSSLFIYIPFLNLSTYRSKFVN